MIATIKHCNINVTNVERSIAFYQEALGLVVTRRKKAADGSFELVYLGDGKTPFEIELTCLKDHPQPYELGENESHICFSVPDFALAHATHEKMGCICYENTAMGLYFIHDPDDYWLEIIPDHR